jgi:putative ABC transport system ATP-binding protein
MGEGLELRELTFLDWLPVTMSVGPGECVGVLGASGSGKSLLLRAIADIDVNRGVVALGTRLREEMAAPEWRSMVGMLPAEPRWWEDDVEAHFREDGGATKRWLERLGFPADVMNWEVRRLSAGERQRLGLVRLLELKPAALLLDEPTANLDGDNTRIVEEVVAEYRADEGVPVVWVSHDREQVGRVAARVYEMKGRSLEAMVS